MTATNFGDNRPPPPKPPVMTLFTDGIPWYRDVRILRMLAQLGFVMLAIGFGVFLINNLVTNLNASNLALDFTVYKRPFGVAIPEGISLTDQWLWVENMPQIALGLWGVLLAAAAYFAYQTYTRYRQGASYWGAALTTLVLAFVVVTSPPDALSASLTTLVTEYFYPSSMSRAFVTGIYNTLRVVVISLIACTVVGIGVGVGLLSKNFLLRSACVVFVEIFRNTPLVVQLIFIYRTFTLILPTPRQSIFGPEAATASEEATRWWILNVRGVYIPALESTESTNLFLLLMLGAVMVAWGVRRWRQKYNEQTGKPAYTWRIITAIVLGAFLVGWFVLSPYTFNFPFLKGPNIQEGTAFSISFISLFLGLTLYTAAFIADIVRAGIQSVPYGQIEAARSQGLNGQQVMGLIVLPQALRLIIPPLGNQYVNLGKNSSLGLIVGYFDTYRITQIANNESGQAVPFFVALMVLYLAISLILSFLTNLINQTTQLKTR